ncbi:hypothetical protein SIN09_28230 [Streptomyces sp. F8]|uniref:hypothetical protein n=1 Tax=Streptomyces sp. F8 TaxID=1436085 RepID=UPI0029CE4F3D|nr:hypothetical protein [Streptomyces sp. F8]MDX6763190.1 hypothetical protein [Streptomyces sp. F8]
MPRRRPGAVRAQRALPLQRDTAAGRCRYAEPPRPWPTRIDRLSPRTVAAVHREECRRPYDEGLRPGATRTALRTCRSFLALPGRWLYLRRDYCACESCDLRNDIAVARDLLELVARRLAPWPRRELRALLAGLDEELWRRTVPDPFAHTRPHRGGAWWHQRLYDLDHLL